MIGLLIGAVVVLVVVIAFMSIEWGFHKDMHKFYKERSDYWFEQYLSARRDLFKEADAITVDASTVSEEWQEAMKRDIANWRTSVAKYSYTPLADITDSDEVGEEVVVASDGSATPPGSETITLDEERFRLTLAEQIGTRPMAEVSREVGCTKEYVRNILAGKSQPSREKAWALMWETNFSEADRNYFAENYLPTLRAAPARSIQ